MRTEQMQERLEEKHYDLDFMYQQLGQAVAFKAQLERDGKTTRRISQKIDAYTGAILSRHQEIEDLDR